MDDPEKEHPMTEQPKKEALVKVKVKVMIMKWKKDIQAREDGGNATEDNGRNDLVDE